MSILTGKKDQWGRPQGFCLVCQTEFWAEREYHFMGLCGTCTARAGDAWCKAHEGEHHQHMYHSIHGVFPPRSPARGKVKKPIPNAIRWEVFERDGFRCKKCGVQKQLTIDHVHPEAKGGTLELDNLQTLCKTCNCSKGARG